MSDFSVNRNSVSNVNLGNNIPHAPNVDPSSNQNPELADAERLSGIIQQNDANNVKPSREELLSKLLGSLQSPITNFARVINQVAEQKSAEA